MRIYVDADACPVVRQTEQVAKRYGVPVTLLCDTNHVMTSDYSEVRIIGAGADNEKFVEGLARLLEVVRNSDGLA